MNYPIPDLNEDGVAQREHRVVIVVYDGAKLLDVAGPADVFSEANRLGTNYLLELV